MLKKGCQLQIIWRESEGKEKGDHMFQYLV